MLFIIQIRGRIFLRRGGWYEPSFSYDFKHIVLSCLDKLLGLPSMVGKFEMSSFQHNLKNNKCLPVAPDMSRSIYKGLVPSKIICFWTPFDLKINKTIVPSSHHLISHAFLNSINCTIPDQFYLYLLFLLWIIILFLQLTSGCLILDYFLSIIKLYSSWCIQTLHDHLFFIDLSWLLAIWLIVSSHLPVNQNFFNMITFTILYSF